MQNHQRIKTFILGFTVALGIVLCVSATQREQPIAPEVGTYQVAVSNDDIVILNTKTGEYIHHFDGAIVGKSKADFRTSSFAEKKAKAKKH